MSDKLIKKEKKFNRTKISASILLVVLASAFMINALSDPPPPYPKISNLTIDPTTADVGESVNITWTIFGFFDIAVVSYGDGNQTQMTMVQENDTYTIFHEYENEGKYNVSIYVANTATGYEDWDGQFITVQNDPPVFDISLDPSQADEDQLVNVSITNLQESDHDKEPGLLSYVYDFGNGNQTTSNSSSILHKWENGGTYPVTVTVIDDQGALNQKTQDIVIGNKAPDPDFTIGSEIPSTYGFYSDLIGAFPFGWTPIDKHYEATYSFENDVGKTGTNIGFVDYVRQPSYNPEVVSEFSGHKAIMSVEDNGAIDYQRIQDSLGSEYETGIVEFWFISDNTGTHYILEGSTVTAGVFVLRITTTIGYINSSGSIVDLCSFNTSQWYHFKIKFNVNTDVVIFYIDGVEYIGTVRSTDDTGLSALSLRTHSNGIFYVDAVGYSWDENYEIGDNEYAHESFDAFKVKEGADHHQKILDVIGDSSSNDVEIYNSFESQPNGTVEFWFMHNNVSTTVPISTFSFRDSANDEEFALLVKNDEWYYRAGGSDTLLNIDHDPVNDTWHHVRVDFLTTGQYMGLSTNSFEVIIDQIESAQIGFSGDEITLLSITTDKGFSGRRAYIDAIGYSWDPNYEVGNNFHIFIEEYYATFDFSEEIVGTAPDDEDWYTPPSSKDGSFSIIDAGGDIGDPLDDPLDEIVEIYDNSTSISLVMEHNYTDQAYGSVEFWVRSNNTNEKIWAFCLMRSDALALAVLMDEDEWKYTINSIDYETINGAIGTPENDTWYHVRIDFRCNGADPYFSLQEGYFTVGVDTVLSSQYQMASVTSINRTRITTGGADTGVAYMDAIGYSWDPYYEIGDNRYPMVHYPEKSLIWFSASQTTDTESDEGSLSYYWDFGDGSSGFGKYVAHEYITSGMYPVELTVMDDNGVKSSKTRIVLISNQYPDINFTSSQGEITVSEGTTVTFDTILDDENADVARMEYYWHLDGDEFNPYNVSEYTQGGWINSYTFTDDHDGTLYAMAKDPENAFDFDAINVTVENVDPSVSISRLDMIANVTFEVERNGPPWYDNNFTFVILGTDDFDLGWPSLYEELNFTGLTDPVVNVKNEDVAFNLLKNWTVYVNTTSQISGTVQYTITLDFQDGQQGKLQSQEFSSGFAYWEPSLDSLWYDDTNFTIKHPVHVGVSMWDPSEDDLSLDLNYTVDMVVEIQCSDTLPISKSFDIDDTYFYDIEVYEQNGKKYANISVYTEVVVADAFNDYEFPVCINNASYLIDPMIDLTELLVTNVEGPLLDDFSIVECISALNVLDALTVDDDGGSNIVDVGFDTQNEVDVSEICLDITLIHKYGGLMEQDITFYLDYYYSSNSSSGASMVFEPISTYTPSEEQTQSSSYGSQSVDSGSDGDSGYASYDTTDSENGGDSGHSAIGDIDLSGSDGGEGWVGTPGVKHNGPVTNQEEDYIDDGTLYTETSWQQGNQYDPSPDNPSSMDGSQEHYPGTMLGGYYSMHQYSNYNDVPGWVETGEDGDNDIKVYTGFSNHDEVIRLHKAETASPKMRYTMGTRDDGYMEYWVYTDNTDLQFTLRNSAGTFKVAFKFTGDLQLYVYEWFTWQWKTIDTDYNDDAWFRFGIDWDHSANSVKYWLWNAAGTLKASGTVGFNLVAGLPYYIDFLATTAGTAYVDGICLEYVTTPTTVGANIDPMQTVTSPTTTIWFPDMDVDSYDRIADFQIRYDVITGETCTLYPYVYNGASYDPKEGVSLGTGSYNDLTIDFTSAQKVNYIHASGGSYYVKVYWIAKHTYYPTIHLDQFTLTLSDVRPGWKEQYYTGGNMYYYYNQGQYANVVHTVDVGSGGTTWERTHGDAKYSFSFSVSQAKTNLDVELYDYVAMTWDNAPGVTQDFSLAKDATYTKTDLTMGMEYVDPSTGNVQIRITDDDVSPNPFTLIMNSFEAEWTWHYDYNSEFEIDLHGMNDFTYDYFTEATIGYTVDSGPVTIDVDVWDWVEEDWEETTGDFTGGDDATGSFTFYAADKGKYISNEKVKVRFQTTAQADFELTPGSRLTNSHEWDYFCDDEFAIELDAMTSYRKSHLTNLDIPYSLDTSESKTLTFWAYNGVDYESITTIITTGGVTKTGTVELDDEKYIYYDSGKYYVDVKFTGISETSFEVNGLDAEYSYSYNYNNEFLLKYDGMNDFRYDHFDEGTISFQFDTDDSNHDGTVYLWNYVTSTFDQIKVIDGGANKQGSIYLDSGNYSNYISPFAQCVSDDLILNLDAGDTNSYPGSGTTWYDISGNDYDAVGDPGTSGGGENSANFPTWNSGYGGYFDFDGTKGLNINDNMGTHTEIAYDIWICRDGSGYAQYISDARNGGGNWFLSNYQDRNINFNNLLEANSPSATYDADSDWWNEWMHLVVMSNPSGSSLYINGEKIDDLRLLDYQSWVEDLGSNFRIGNRYTSSGRLDGKIAAFRIYDRVLTESEIAQNYKAFNERIYGRVSRAKFAVSDTDFNLDSLSASWDYSYSYYDTYEVDLSEMTQFRYDYFDECTLDYQIDLPRAGKSTSVYLYNFTKSDWDYFTTTTGGGNDIQDSITFNTIDYIDSSSDKTRIKFTGFTDSEFNKDSIVANYSWEYDVQDKYYTVLSGMTPHKYDTFEECNITYSLQTTEDQTLQVQLFNFTSSEWTSVGSPFNTIKDAEYNGSTLFTSDEFIHPTEYQTRIFFSGIQDSFLTLNSLENNYSQSHFYTYTDFGYDDQGMEGEPYADMTADYRNVYKTHHIFDYAGKYVVTWNVSDGMYETQVGQLIEIIYPIPSVSIGDLPDIVLEDQEVLLESNIGYNDSVAKYQFFWEFGDGHHSVDRDPLHRWSDSDNYSVTLHVRDLYGNYYNDTVIVEVEEIYPEITGPYGFSGIEGQAITLDVAVSDSLFDRKDLTFTWYDENDQEITGFANNPKPIVILDDGVYNYSLEVEDVNGYKDSAEIIITVSDVPPSVFIKNYVYHGDANSGSLTLTAYALDYSEDMNTLEFTWRISHNHTVDNRGPYSNANRSSITFDATKTAIYQGEVSVKDPSTNTINKQVFYISSVIDSNGNGFSDEFEEQLAENGENIYDYFDTDKDGISDLYEIANNQTNYLDPDTDNDGLYDGIDRSTGMGERPAGTNPIDYDSDDDLLSDGEEVYGWEISTDQQDVIYVSSDPWLNDTDNDGWTDYEEYLKGTHPRNVDTDLDGVNDPQDPFPLEADKDEDGLLDSEEIAVGTDCDNSDTDEDTLTDGEEVRGGITNPLSADTDRDFATDSAEIVVKQKSIQNRLSLDQPVVLSFDHYFRHAAAAQITFVLAFGEYNGTIDYGVENVPDLNVKISKMDSNLVLYEGNTNGDRYFSHAVDFRELIEEKGYNYYGDYVISVDGTGCLLEQYDINVIGLLDPRDADTDNDGIMDGIEIDTLTRGKSIIDITSSPNYDNNNIVVGGIDLPDPYYNFNIEVGSVQLSNTIDQSVSAHVTFENEFWIPVVVAYVNSKNEVDSVEVRVENVTSVGCDIFMEEPGDGSHASETINYIVVEYGEWGFEDGTEIKAGIVNTDQNHQGGSSYSNWEQIDFFSEFSTSPVVLHTLNSYINEDFKTSIVSSVSTTSFNVTQESAETGTSTSYEAIGWIAIEAGKTGTINNVKYETIQENDGDADGVDDDGHSFSFTDFTQTPLAIVSQSSANNVDGSWARSDGVLSSSVHTTNAEEDQVGDSERNHPDEYFGIVAFEEEFSYGYHYTPPPEVSVPVIESWEHDGSTVTSTTLMCAKPSGVEVGDLLVLIPYDDDSGTTDQYSDNKVNWTFVNEMGDRTSDSHVAIFYKIADGYEPASETVTSVSKDDWGMWYLRISGVDESDPLEAVGSEVTVTSTQIGITGVDTNVDNCLALYVMTSDGGDVLPFSASTGWTEVDEDYSGPGGSDVGSSFGYKNMTSSGSSGTATITGSASDGLGGFQVAFKGEIDEIGGGGDIMEEEPEPINNVQTIKIPDWGTVYDANITVTVASEDTPLGYGTVNITLYKEDVDCRIDDVVLIDYDVEFNETDVYFDQFINLTPIVNDETIHQFYGNYRLEIVIFDSSDEDVFNITKFSIETDTYVQASEGDYNVWITDPSNSDTDGDEVSDYDEIYGWTRGSDTFYTNPLSKDTDGDNAEDKIDRHPTENVMIKISPLSATHANQFFWEASPKLEIAISYELNGDTSQKIFSSKVTATEDLWRAYIFPFWYEHYQTANFAANDVNYYVDIDDDPNVQPEDMDFSFSLWHMECVDFFAIPLWDTWLAEESVAYSIGDVGDYTTFDLYDVGLFGHNNEIHVKVETISVEKGNTIAIYDNETTFNGHYKEKVKMNVIVLNVTGDVSGTPFVQGPNSIVIPTELFIETKLNSYLERDKLEDTPLYSAIEGEYEFISVGRNGSTDEGCDEIDFVIIRFNIDATDAMAVLTMLTTIIVNDTTGEEVEKYEYQSTKEDGVNPVLMNLHKAVLGYIPWYCDFANSPQGDEPDNFLQFWAKVFVATVMAIAYIVYMIGMAIVQIFEAIVKFVDAVVMAVLTSLGPLLWLIIRAVLLVFAFILLALHLVAQIPLYIMMGVSMLILTAFMGGYCEFSWNFVEFSLDNERVFRMQSDIVWIRWDFFDMSFPWVDDKIIIDGEVIMSTKESILGFGLQPDAEISEDPVVSEATQSPPTLHSGYNQTIGSTYNFYTTYQDYEGDAPDPSYGVKLHLIKPDGNAITPYAMEVHPDAGTNYVSGILYNYTIDLDTIYQGQGLWHYYFSTEDNSGTHDTVYMPQEGYMLGPIDSPAHYLLSSTVSTDYPDEYWRPSGLKNANFTFVSTWWSQIVPDSVYMCLVPANISTGTGASKTVGVQKFEMVPIEQSPDYTSFVDYYCVVNFTELGYSDDEIGRFSHYYEAIYNDGNKTYLHDFSKDVEVEEGYYDTIATDFNYPYVGAPEAQIFDYDFDGADFVSAMFLGRGDPEKEMFGNWLVMSEMNLRFDVTYMDPNGNPPLEMPQLTFVRVIDGEELTPIEMEKSTHIDYGVEEYSYTCVVSMANLPPGVWEFKFDAKDSEGVPIDSLYGKEKLWMQGSGLEVINGFSLAALMGNVPLIGYSIALPLSNAGPWGQAAAAIISIAATGFAIFQAGSTFFNLLESKNAGAMLGLCLGSFFSCLATSNAFSESFASIGKYIGNILIFMMISQLVVGLIGIPLKWIDTGGIFDMVVGIASLPVEFFMLIGTSIMTNIFVQLFAKQANVGNKVVKACMRTMQVFQALVAIASFFSWLFMVEPWALLMDGNSGV